MAIYGPFTSAAAAGGAGVATGTVTSPTPVRGFVAGIYIQYNDSPPAATADVTIATAGKTGILPAFSVLVISNAATNGYFIPQVQTVTAAAAATGQYSLFCIEDYVTVTLAQANDADSVTVWLYMVN